MTETQANKEKTSQQCLFSCLWLPAYCVGIVYKKFIVIVRYLFKTLIFNEKMIGTVFAYVTLATYRGRGLNSLFSLELTTRNRSKKTMRLVLAAALMCIVGSANAIPITEAHDIDENNSVGYSTFEVTSEGWFDIHAENDSNGRVYRPWWSGHQIDIDPVMYIFSDVVSHTSVIGFDDDSGVWYNAEAQNYFLEEGFYVAAVSDFEFTLDEAVSGVNSDDLFAGTIDVTVENGRPWLNSVYGYTPDAEFATVPEPGSLALMGAGLMAAFGMRRRLKNV